jgi:hypothetical protein
VVVHILVESVLGNGQTRLVIRIVTHFQSRADQLLFQMVVPEKLCRPTAFPHAQRTACQEGTVEQALSQMITSGTLLLEVIRGESLVFLPHLPEC